MGNTFKLGNYVNAIFQDASNNVGIGAAPSGSYKLEVTGTSNFTGVLRVGAATGFAVGSIAGYRRIEYTGTTFAMLTNADGYANLNAGAATFSSSISASSFIKSSIYCQANDGTRDIYLTAIADFGLGILPAIQVASNHGLQFATNNTLKMFLSSGGFLGIGTSNPITPLSLTTSTFNSQISTGSIEIQSYGVNNAWIADNVYYNNGFRARVTGYTSQIYFLTDGGIAFLTTVGQTTAGNAAGLTQRMVINAAGAVTISGSLSKGSGSFRIDHPLESMNKTHQLVHSFIEGPQADLIYRGKLSLVNGKAQANIDKVSAMTDGTFEVLCREVQCFTTNESGWDLIKGKVIGNIIYIESQNPNSTDEISWMVIGERKDKHMMDTEWTDDNGKVIVEPLKPIEPTMPSEPTI